MAGTATAELPTLPASTPEHAVADFAVPIVSDMIAPQSITLPSSPSFAPTPPPPNSIV